MNLSKLLLVLTAFCFFAVPTNAQTSKKSTTAKTTKTADATKNNFKTQVDSISYALGMDIANNVMQSELPFNAEFFAQAVIDVFAKNNLKLSQEQAETQLQALNEIMRAKQQEMQAKEQAEQSQKAAGNKVEGTKFLTENQKRAGVITTPSGLQYEILVEGTGKQPKETSKVTVHYTGTLINGTVFDSSVERGEPIEFPLNGVIPGWTEGLQLMKEGGKAKLYLPSDLAYGDREAGPMIAPGSTLIFEVELIKVSD
jgi:FKBP-type peptidyl-prolyl cis-trans isomerase